ncbi:type VII secretion protein EccCa [Rugosimonospora africana]|uniref:Type VII secretion protein EccC n=1 Tax=Rugosimonospora africana TaxID=556532 RepID=A0A8J3QXY8_9ACTN|nr:type VII secretion protein EccCa [Rugosimonospora africana]GIH18187.1 type VII secretion protein EccC [Rugosimonospora africana]
MATVVVTRGPRRPAPALPTGKLAIQAPPEVRRLSGSRWGQLLAVLPMLTGTVATAMMFAGRQGGAYSYVVGAVFGVSSLGMLATGFGSLGGAPKKAEMMAARREYLRHLAGLRRRVRETATRQRDALHYRHPGPATLWSVVDSYRLWERRPGDGDFGVARVGTGPQTLATPLVAPETGPLDELEPMTAGALRRFLDAHAVVPELPVAVAVSGFARLYLRGGDDPSGDTGDSGGLGPDSRAGRSGAGERVAPEERVRGLIRALLAQLAAFHAPADLLIAVCASHDRRPQWEYLKWLPHALHPTRTDRLGPVRLIAGSGPELERLLGDVIANRPRFGPGNHPSGPQVVVVADGGDLTRCEHLTTEGGVAGVTLIDLDRTPPRLLDRATISLTVRADGTLHSDTLDERGEVGLADSLELPAAEAFARQLAPLRLAPPARAGDGTGQSDLGLAELLGVGDPDDFTAATGWAPRPGRDRLRVPIGVGEAGHPVELDLKESAQDGMGPHGLLIGATGSGKSELLRTLVLGLAATHDSESLNFVLIDFKGGATFASLDRLPHTAAVITNLRDQLPLVDRMTDALNGELQRRQELLKRAGNFASLRDYERARAGTGLAPLPVLLVVCDEFSELLFAKPDFIETFVQIGRLGRSLGVHLLLASQRLEEGRLRGLETHLSYRIGLRTFSAMESRSVLGVPDAYELPRSPGHGFLRYATEPLQRFRAAYVSGPYLRPGPAPAAAGILDYTSHLVSAPVPSPDPAPAAPEPAAPSLLDILVDRLAGGGPAAHQVWLPPLDRPAPLEELIGPLVTEPSLGLTTANPQLRGALQVPVALVDKPFDQLRELLWLSLDGSGGHLAIVGGPRSGKSTLLLTVLCGLALSHTPRQVQVYCLDFGGGSLAGTRDLPQVGGVAGRLETDAVRRTVGEVTGLLTTREREGLTSRDGRADVFLVVDGWATIRSEYDDLEPTITDLATRGLAYGIHVLVTATRWMDLRPAIRDLFGSRLELRLGDPADSLISRKAAGNVPENSPGRGLTTDAFHFLAAAPPPDALIAAVAAGWSGPKAPRVRLLPTLIGYDEVDLPGETAIGIAESDLLPVALDFAAEPHFLLFGDSESGKSSFLRALATSITRRYPPEAARVVIVDYRRSLLGAVESDHLIGYATGAAQTAELVEAVAGYMKGRLPGPDLTPQQLRDRSWWSGPDCYLLVDDYDLVAAGPSNPLHPLLEYLAQARDIGLHLVLTRRTGGAGRSMYEPVIQRLRELSTPGLVLSGDRDEGALLGTVRPGPLPPGRGWLVTRREGVRLIQLAYLPPA